MVPSTFIKRTMPALLGLAAVLTGCGGPKQLTVSDAWVRLAAVPGRPAAAYFTLHGGPADATLINVTTDVAVRSEMHESMTDAGGMSGMRPLASVAVPAASDVAFRPGGRHVMLFNVNPGVRPGERRILLTFTFSDGTRFQRNAVVLAAGDPAPQ